jgi:Putative zinc-finger
MNHDEAVRMMAGEKYMLQELSPDVRDQFEEHMFSCEECALDVRTCAAFIDKAKTELAADERPQQAAKAAPEADKWWLSWLRPAFAAPALAILLAVAMYQDSAIRGLQSEVAENHAPAIVSSVSLINADSRGAEKRVITLKPGQSFEVPVDIPTDSNSASYVAELYGPSGKSRWSLPVSAEAAKDTVRIRVPGVQTGGAYALVIHAVAPGGSLGAEIARYPFELQTQSK